MSCVERRNLQPLLAVALLLVSLPLPAEDREQTDAWLFAPMEVIGTRLEDWSQYFGAEYEVFESSDFDNKHTGQPMVFLRVGDRRTKVGFFVNLETDEEFILSIETTSAELLEKLGIDGSQISPRGNLIVTDDWDAGLNRLEIYRRPDGVLGASWAYYLD